jgi:hypothetical protein
VSGNPKTFQPTTVASAYNEALAYLDGKSSRKIAHNTYLVSNDATGEILITYHGNIVVTMTMPEGTDTTRIVVSSCGYRTYTTKARLNWFLPRGTWDGERWHDNVGVYQEAREWYLAGPEPHRVRRFEDGMMV